MKKIQILIKKTVNNATPLFIAVQDGHADICAALPEKNAKVNEIWKNRATALVKAAKNDHPDVCTVLLENNANSMKEEKLKQRSYL